MTTETLSMPATLSDAVDMFAIGEADWPVEVDGDRKCIILWAIYADGTRQVADLLFWE